MVLFPKHQLWCGRLSKRTRKATKLEKGRKNDGREQAVYGEVVAAGRGETIPLKETLDQPDPTWLQWRRRLDKVEPFCRIAGHTSEEVRDILASLETVYQELFYA